MVALHARERDELEAKVPRVLRHVAGYNLHRLGSERPNLAELLVGSEGTLGMFTAIELRLSPVPTHRVLGVAHFPTLHTAMDAVQHIVELETGVFIVGSEFKVALVQSFCFLQLQVHLSPIGQAEKPVCF